MVLVDGSPGSREVLEKPASLLSPRFHVIVPDLPGFGASTRDLPDYSFRAHGEYLLELLDALHIDRAQFVGFSTGGGVVLSIADFAPQRVASLVMLSAIGIQEYELAGNYCVNHVLHGPQLGALWLLKNCFPHFGLFRGRLLRSNTPETSTIPPAPLAFHSGEPSRPMLIIHGTRDRNVLIAAALEHHRMVSQSEIFEFDENHFMAFMHPAEFLDPLERFLDGVR